MRLLDLIRREKVAVTVAGDVLVVTMAGTDFEITYEKTDENRLVACSFRGDGTFRMKDAGSAFQGFWA